MNKKLRIFITAIAMVFTFTSVSFAASVAKPIVSVSSIARDAITVQSNNCSNAEGYQIKYGTKSSLSGAKTITVTSKTGLNKKISGLKASTKYYVKVRAYVKNAKGSKKYGAWSATKSCSTKAYTVAYVNVIKLNLEPSKKSSNMWNSDPKNYIASYMDEVRVYGSTGTYTKNQWVKLSYKGKTRYTYIMIKNGKNPFTTTKKVFTYENYEKYCSNEYQRAILKSALDLYNSGRTITHTDYDCSMFTRYIYQQAELLRLPATPKSQYDSAPRKIGSVEELQVGDLVFFDDRNDGGIDHAAIYLGDGVFIQSAGIVASGADGMSIRPLTGKYLERFEGGGRYYE